MKKMRVKRSDAWIAEQFSNAINVKHLQETSQGRTAYTLAKKRGIFDDVSSHFQYLRNLNYSEKDMEILLSYDSWEEAFLKHSAMIRWITKRPKFKNKYCSHLKKDFGHRTVDCAVIGKVYNHNTVIDFLGYRDPGNGNQKVPYVLTQCDCGSPAKEQPYFPLQSGCVVACGCRGRNYRVGGYSEEEINNLCKTCNFRSDFKFYYSKHYEWLSHHKKLSWIDHLPSSGLFGLRHYTQFEQNTIT